MEHVSSYASGGADMCRWSGDLLQWQPLPEEGASVIAAFYCRGKADELTLRYHVILDWARAHMSCSTVHPHAPLLVLQQLCFWTKECSP